MQFSWERYWVAREQPISLDAHGFLEGPAADIFALSTSHLSTFDQIIATPCLALLGDPGTGKTTELEKAIAAAEQHAETDGTVVLSRRLRKYSTDHFLVHDLFEGNQFRDWIDGDHVLELFLDDLDECALRVGSVAALLHDQLAQIPREVLTTRSRLRIACRTLDWPITLERELPKLWDQDQFAIYELAPLRASDVALAAQGEGLDRTQFLDEVVRREVGAFAARPLTLQFLLDEFKRSGTLPTERTELFRRGCEHLCRETNTSRIDSRLQGLLSSQQRFAVASRVGVATIFSGFNEISTTGQAEPTQHMLSVASLAGRTESVGGDEFSVGEAAIRETLGTGLFTGWGSQSVGWAHRSLGEFLAADYLVRRNVALPQIMSLLVRPGDAAGVIAPQLRDVAGWLATMRADVFDAILETDPRTLLLSDLGVASDDARSRLVGALMLVYQEDLILDRDWDVLLHFRKLDHVNLAVQMQSVLLDVEATKSQKLMALAIAEQCQVTALFSDVLRLALDPDQHIDLRVAAARVVAASEDETAKGDLKPLVSLPPKEDPREDLRGVALRASWPRHFENNELFQVVKVPRREGYFGEYKRFLYRDLSQLLVPDQLPAALDWATKQVKRDQIPYELTDTVDGILRRAWKNLDVAGVLPRLARAISIRLSREESIFSEDDPTFSTLLNDVDSRRSILADVLARLPNQLWSISALQATGLANQKDIDWMITQIRATSRSKRAVAWAALVRSLVDLKNPEHIKHLDALYDLHKRRPTLRPIFNRYFGSIQIDSPDADVLRTEYHDHLRLAQRLPAKQQRRQARQEQLLAQIGHALDEIEAESFASWISLVHTVLALSHSSMALFHNQPDLTAYVGWSLLDDATRTRILHGAEEYLGRHTPEPERWLLPDTGNGFALHFPDDAGYAALELLYRQRPDHLSALETNFWRDWSPVIVGYRNFGDETIQQALIGQAYAIAPDVVVATAMKLLDLHGAESGADHVLHRLEYCWDDKLKAAVVDKLRQPELPLSMSEEILKKLLKLGADDGIAYASECVSRHDSSDTTERERAEIAARLLLLHAAASGWEAVWPAIQANTDFGRSVLVRVGWDDPDGWIVFAQLTEDQLAALYLWLHGQFPLDEDPMPDGAHAVSRREAIGRWRSALPGHLRQRGTPEAVASIKRLQALLPEPVWLARLLAEAQEEMRRATWQWPAVADVFALIGHPDRRLIESADQLLDLVIESLQRLQVKLQLQESRSVVDLWNDISPAAVQAIVCERLGEGNGTGEENKPEQRRAAAARLKARYRPKDEIAFSDYVKRHLDDDLKHRGVVVNREVENRLRNKTDIQVDAIKPTSAPLPPDVVTVIIEAKGCWNRELKKAMQTQLVERYLNAAGRNHGLYLVGWFRCEKWDPTDGRRGDTPHWTVNQAREFFAQQAAALATTGKTVGSVVLDTSLPSGPK